jgi:hypothetical protein
MSFAQVSLPRSAHDAGGFGNNIGRVRVAGLEHHTNARSRSSKVRCRSLRAAGLPKLHLADANFGQPVLPDPPLLYADDANDVAAGHLTRRLPLLD